jgi:hypothetical protein
MKLVWRGVYDRLDCGRNDTVGQTKVIPFLGLLDPANEQSSLLPVYYPQSKLHLLSIYASNFAGTAFGLTV